MRRALPLIGLLLLAACQNPPPPESFRQPSPSSVSGSMADADSPNEGMPVTTDSLEVAADNAPVQVTALSGGVLFGDGAAPALTIWSDYGCEYCRQFALGQMRALERRYVRDGRLSVRMLFLPRSEAGTLMAKTAICGLRQDKFHAVHGTLSAQPVAVMKDLTAFAKKTGLDLKKLTACVNDPSLTTALDAVAQQAKTDEIVRVPFFGVGQSAWIGLKQDDDLFRTIEQELRL